MVHAVPRKGYDWAIGEPPPTLEAHSLAKHEVLRRYLLAYVAVLTSNPKVEHFRLTLVDGFAGGGAYISRGGASLSGSPLIMLDAMREASVAAQALRTKQGFHLDVEYFFIERKAQAFAYLCNVLKERGFRPNDKRSHIHAINGDFIEHAETIIQSIKSRGRARRAIFLLDQYGYSEVPLSLIRYILTSLPHAEVIITIAADWLFDYMQDSRSFRETLLRSGLSEVESSLDDILVAKNTPAWRRLAQSALSDDLARGSGASFYTPFFIASEASTRDYWLVHLSMHARARDEMTKLHWALKNTFQHYGRSGLHMLGYAPSEDPAVTGQASFAFDDAAASATQDALMEDIPKAIASLEHDGTSFQSFFESVCNHTPASREHVGDVVRALGRLGEIELTDKDGKPRRGGARVLETDLVRPARQLFLDRGRKWRT